MFNHFIAVGRMGLRLTSPDGAAWSAPQLAKDPHTLASIATGNGCVVAAGMFGTGQNVFYRSTDLQQWESATAKSDYVYMLHQVAFGGGRFMAMSAGGVNGDDSGVMQFSDDGLKWGERLPRAKKAHSLGRVVRGKDAWLGIGSFGLKSVSADGQTWQDATGQTPADTLIDVAYGNGMYVGGGLGGLRMSSADGLTWGARDVGEEGEHIHAMVFTGKEFVGVGLGATYVSKDGQRWTRTPNHDAPVSCAYARGTFVGAAYKGRILVSRDAITWKQVATCPQHIQAIAFV